jgi:hypothetical protein
MQKYNDFLKELESIKQDVEKALSERKIGIQGDGSVKQLEAALSELQTIKYYVINDKLPPKGRRHLEIAWHITDSWRDDSILGDKILRLVNIYQDKLE